MIYRLKFNRISSIYSKSVYRGGGGDTKKNIGFPLNNFSEGEVYMENMYLCLLELKLLSDFKSKLIQNLEWRESSWKEQAHRIWRPHPPLLPRDLEWSENWRCWSQKCRHKREWNQSFLQAALCPGTCYAEGNVSFY